MALEIISQSDDITEYRVTALWKQSPGTGSEFRLVRLYADEEKAKRMAESQNRIEGMKPRSQRWTYFTTDEQLLDGDGVL